MGYPIIVQAIVSGLAQAAVYAVVAVGLTLTFGVMRVVNFAHGDFLMLAMYAGYFGWSLTGMDPAALVFLLMPLSIGVAYLFHKTVVLRLLKVTEVSQMAVTLGISLLLQNLALLAFTADNRMVNLERSLRSVKLAGASLQLPQLVLGVASLLVVGALYLLIRKTEFGLKLRAVSGSVEGAILSGINVGRAYMVATCIGVGTLGVAGPLLASSLYVNPYIGILFTLKAFVIVIVGGLGSFEGALLGALLVGLTESVAGIWFPASVAAAIPFLILIVVLLVRPEGLLGREAAR